MNEREEKVPTPEEEEAFLKMSDEERKKIVAGRFGWNDDDVIMRDEDGNVITPRQAKEMQLERLRSEVEEDLPADLKDK